MKSIWQETLNRQQKYTDFNEVQQDSDVIVAGSGIAGILTAFELQKRGLKVLVLDSGQEKNGITQYTTAKITAQHHLIYDSLIKHFGNEKASQYAQANQSAIQKYKDIITSKNIECDFEEKSAFVYSLHDADIIQKEIAAAQSVGLPARYAELTHLPFKIDGGSMEFTHQAQFQPTKFLNALSAELTICTDVVIHHMQDSTLYTSKGEIKAKHIVLATHFPFMNFPGYYFLRMYQERSYVVALKNAQDVKGMYIDEDKKGISLRNYQDVLLYGGKGHRTGSKIDQNIYNILYKEAKTQYPDAELAGTWSAQDCITLDGIPYIGRFSKKFSNVYLATGFGKWGITNSMVASDIIADLICGAKNEYAPIFDPARPSFLPSTKNFLMNGLKISSGFLSRICLPASSVKDVQRGEGKMITYQGKKIGVYIDKDDKIYAVKTKCPHLGCQLSWNQTERSWDCPCHGSRFDYTGKILDGPSTKSLLTREVKR